MRISMLALAAIVTGAVLPATAQTLIDVEGQKAPPPKVQDQPRPQDHAPVQTQAPTQTQEDPRPPIQSRYSFNRVDDGFLRVDNETGQIAYCRARGAGWTCEAVPDDRSGLETQISRLHNEVASLKKLGTEITHLQDEVRSLKKLEIGIAGLKDEIASLKKEVAALKDPPPPRPPADLTPSTADRGGDVTIKLPTQEDIARARAFVEETWRRLVDIIVSVQKDMMRKG